MKLCNTSHLMELLTIIWDDEQITHAYRDAMYYQLDKVLSSYNDGRLSLQLPMLCSSALGGETEKVIPLQLAWILWYCASELLDEAEDSVLVPCETFKIDLNVSTGLLFSTSQVLARLPDYGHSYRTANIVNRECQRLLLQVCAGQHLDLIARKPTLGKTWEIATKKSGIFLSTITWAAARLLTDDLQITTAFRKIGEHLGILMQICDDLVDIWGGNLISDLATKPCSSLPVSYALSVLPSHEQSHLLQLLENAKNDDSVLTEARDIIIRSGAAVYLIVNSRKHVACVEELLLAVTIPSEGRDKLQELLKSFTYY